MWRHWALAAVAAMLLLGAAAQAEATNSSDDGKSWAALNSYATSEDHSKVREARRQARRAHAHAQAQTQRTHAHAADAGAGQAGGGQEQSPPAQAGAGQEHGHTTQTRADSSQEHSHAGAQEQGQQAQAHAGQEQGGAAHSQPAASGAAPRSPYLWDGQPSWEWDNPRTLYFEPVAGLGNRLRALASAVVMAREFGVGLRVIWREEVSLGEGSGNPGFNSTWPDLFSEPKLRLAPNFPGSTYNTLEEGIYLRAKDRDEQTPPLQPGQCLVHYPVDYPEMKALMQTAWQTVEGREMLCVKSDRWLTEAGEKEGKFFFRLLRPSPTVQAMVDRFKYESEWEQNHMVGVHVRRGDLTVYGKDNDHKKITALIPIESYIDTMHKQKALAAGVKRVRFFLATDDAEAEAAIRAAFKPGYVLSYQKSAWSRLEVAAIQQALVDVLLLADCPVLIGTYYSSYSETAKMMGWPFFIQVGHELKQRAIETVIAKEDPEEEEDAHRRRRRRLIGA